MWIFGFYRFYLCLLIAIFSSFKFDNWWILAPVFIGFRATWFAGEHYIHKIVINRNFKKHIQSFKQDLGPYGIRIANKAENDWQVKKSVSEVFVSDRKKLKKTVEQLEMMDTLFKAGMRPDGDQYLIHDLKLKYGKKRLNY